MSRAFDLSVIAGLLVITPLVALPASAQTPPAIAAACDVQALAQSKAEFESMTRRRSVNPVSVSDDDLRRASTDYVVKANACYDVLYGGTGTTSIDTDGVWFAPPGAQAFATWGTKWGAGSPFASGTDVSGPRLPGGTVSYSFMSNGVDMSLEGFDPSLAISSLPTYSTCFITEIRNAFAAWSAVANIQFVETSDDGVAFNAAGASGDIRIGTHTFDGAFGTLAHGYFPPPNGASAAGDIHFDRAENWSCAPGAGLFDVGIVAIHEIGHAIGLNHEMTNPAIMQPFYNASVPMPLADDITGATSIYGGPLAPPRATRGDFDGDHKTDFAVWRPASGIWFEIGSSRGISAVQWGAGYAPYNDSPAPGDYDGDGRIDAAVWRASTGIWYVIRSSDDTAFGLSLGSSTDRPVQGDYDGDGKTDAAVWHPSSGTWEILKSTNGTIVSRLPGVGHAPGDDIPVPADYDGDGTTDIAIWRASTGVWYVTRSSDGVVANLQWGAGYAPYFDRPVPSDYDGDGRTDMAIWRTSTGQWAIVRSSDSGIVVAQWGAGNAPYGDVPVPGDYDGDGKADVAVWRSSNGFWLVVLSSSGEITVRQWGATTDVPIPEP